MLAAAAVLLGGCANPPAEPTASRKPLPASVPSAAPAPRVDAAPASRSLSDWKRSAAERIQAANRSLVFVGSPPNPLRAVVVVEMTIAADGQIRRADVLRVPNHSKELGGVALRSLHAAAPLPPPPKALVVHGPVRVTETWLFRDDGQFQIRTLASAQTAVN